MMSTNLVSTIMQSLSSEAIGRIASSLALDQTAAQRGVSAGIPGILAALANAASSPDGAQRIGSAVSQIEDMPGSDIVSNLLDSNHRNLADSGWSTISSLLGGGTLEALSTVIAQFAGFGQASAKRLLGLLTPLVLGFLRREQVSSGLDSRGLASLLSSQRETIERAIPAGVARRLQDAGMRPASQPVAAGSFRRPAASAPQASSSRSWAYWLLPALVAAAAVLWLLPAPQQTRTVQDINRNTTTIAKDTAAIAPAVPREQQPAPATTAMAPASVTLENDLVSNIARLRNALQTIKDPGSAQAALGELKEITAQFGHLKAMAQLLSPEARKALAAAVAARVPDLNGLIDRIGSDANLSGEAKPAMDSLRSELVSISKA
ncbi:MAG: DUF937 domain-containing protein [Rhodomicrobium sp.]